MRIKAYFKPSGDIRYQVLPDEGRGSYGDFTADEARELRDKLVDVLGLPDKYSAFEDLRAVCVLAYDVVTDPALAHLLWAAIAKAGVKTEEAT